MLTIGSSLCAMALHRHMGIEMIQSSIGFFATLPATLVHSLDFLISATGAFMLVRAWNWYERIIYLSKGFGQHVYQSNSQSSPSAEARKNLANICKR